MPKRGEIFNTAPVTAPNKSSFDMSNDNLLSCSAGTIVPHNCIECLPGDNIKQRTNVFGRVAPMLAPTFGKCDVMTYDFYVRYRDVWPDFDEFITNQSQDKASTDESFVAPLMPQVGIRDLLFNYEAWKTIMPHMIEREDGFLQPIENFCTVLKVTIDDANSSISIEEIQPWTLPNRDGNNWLIPFDESDDVKNLWITVLPNRSDMLSMEDYINNYPSVLDGIGMLTAKLHYNFLSNGDLAELLGIDMSAFYHKQVREYFDVVRSFAADMRNQEHLASIDIALTHLPEIIRAVGDRVIINITYNYQQDIDFAIGINYVDDTSLQSESVELAGKQAILDLFDSIDAQVSLLPFFAYNFVYDEYFRDQNYIDKSIAKKLASGALSMNNFRSLANSGQYVEPFYDFFTLRRKAYMHDPYTSSLPKAQRGEPVRYLSDANLQLSDLVSIPSGSTYRSIKIGNSIDTAYSGSTLSESATSAYSVNVDLSAATIENFRWANSMQRYLEAVNRTGGRYFEYMLGIFGESIPDSKINRPIYLNGNRTPVQISEVLQTSMSDISTAQPLGDMAGRGIVVGNDESIDYDVPDFGVYLQLAVVVPRTSYMSGLNPMFTRETYLDFPIPQFAQLGEEYVRTSELWFDGTQDIMNKPFGFQSRYYQWKYKRDEVHSDFLNILDYWHWSRKFNQEPINGREFLEIDPDYRQFAVTDKGFDHFYLYFEHNVEMLRPLPTFGVPTL